MKYLNEGASQTPKQEEVKHFDRSGNPVINNKEVSFAKVVETQNNTRHYILVHENVPYDTGGMYSHREPYIQLKHKMVSKETFDFYMMFLKTSNSLYLTRANRSFLND